MEKAKEILNLIQQLLPEVKAIYLFGSRSHGAEHPRSDFDIAILNAKKISFEIKQLLQDQLADLLKNEVDLLDMNAISTVMQYQIIMSGQRLFADKINTVNHFESKVLALYLTLNDDRKPITDQILMQNSIYG